MKPILISKKAFRISTDIGNIGSIKNSSRILALSCQSLGFYKEAYRAQVTYKSMSDSLFNDQNIKNIANLEYHYKYEKEREILEIEQIKKDKLAAFEIRKQKLVRNILIVGVLLMVVFIIVILRSFAQKRKAHKLLALKNIEIENQAEELRASNESLVQLSNFKEDMTNMIIHDLKNPLSAIVNAAVVQDEKRRTELINHSGFQMMNLVENILEVYKYESTEIELSKERIGINDIIKSSIKEVAFLVKMKTLDVNISAEEGLIVEVDSRMLRRIFVNILSNAVKYANVESQISIKVYKADKNNVKFEIHNYGSYIPPEKQEMIFDKFGQVNKKNQGGLTSTGLGLTFCKVAIGAHEGAIGVLSDQKEGTTLWFTLPDNS